MASSTSKSKAIPPSARAASGAPLYAFEKEELNNFVLPTMDAAKKRSATAAAASATMVPAGVTSSLPSTAMSSLSATSSLVRPPRSVTGIPSTAGSGYGPAHTGSGTLSLVKAAFGVADEESKSKEIDELASRLANASSAAPKAVEAPSSVSADSRAGGAQLDPITEALMEAKSLQTGEEAAAFFMKHGASCPVKFIYAQRRYPIEGDIFKPYELSIIDFSEVGEEYFTISAGGVVFVSPGEPSEFLSLSEWMRDHSAFNICRGMRFFKYFLRLKMFQVWRQNVRFNRYCKQRFNVRNRLFSWKTAFSGAIQDIQGALAAMSRVPLLDMNTNRYSVNDFNDAQQAARAEAGRNFEKQIAVIQARIERVVADVTRRARANDDNEDDGEDDAAAARAKALQQKSMAAAKAEANRRAAAQRSAQAEEAVLSQFVRMVDYMIVETIASIVTSVFGQLFHEISDPDHRRGGPGMFLTAVKLVVPVGQSQAITTFEPACEDLTGLVDVVVAETIKTCTSTTRILYARPFREYVQQLPAVAGTGNLGAPTVAALLADSPEFRSIRDQIESKFKADYSAAAQYATVFDSVRPIYEYGQAFDFEAYKAQEMTTYGLQRDMSRLKAWDSIVERMRSQQLEGCLFIDSKRLKFELEPVTSAGMERLKGLLLDLAKVKCRATSDAFMSRSKILDSRISQLEKFAAHMERLNGVRDAEAALVKESSSVEDMYKLLASYEVKVSSDESVALDEMRNSGLVYTDSFRKSEQWLEERLPEMSRELDVNIIKITEQIKVLGDSVNEGAYLDASQPSSTVVSMLAETSTKLAALQSRTETFNKWQTLFATSPYEFKQLKAAQKLLETRGGLWGGLNDFESKHKVWTEGPFKDVDVEELARDVQAFQKTSFMLDKQLADDVTALFKAKVAAFKVYVPVITDLGNKSMRDRHFKRIYEEFGAPFTPNNPSRNLGEMLAFGVETKAELVSEISGTASGEAQLEASLSKVVDAWAVTDFIIKGYREQKNVFTLGSLEEINVQLEDHQVTLQTMMGSRYIMGVRDAVELWAKRLSLLSDTIDEWVAVQRNWMYLETIFSAEDIQRQLPAEAQKFKDVDRKWKEIMLKTSRKPNVIAALDTGDWYLKTFVDANENLDQIQKSLEDYLETKRGGFPRFYFLSNDELLAILSQTRDPQAVQPHLSKCFDALKNVDFGKGEASANILAMNSSEGEKVPLSEPVVAQGNVEDWLTQVEKMMRKSLYDQSKMVVHKYPPFEQAIERKDWYFCGPAQSVIMVDQIFWTQYCATAIKAVGAGDSHALATFLAYSKKQLEAMAALVRLNITRLQRTLMGAVLTIDVHARDVVTAMDKKKTSSLEEFEWTKQLRYYWDKDVDDCVVRQTNTRFIYGYEYLGNSDRLVITPLTDTCYMTLTGALNLKFGGAPAGPAGTGKTETTKDLSKALANQCVVFNCSDGLDYKIMGRFHSGLAQAGAWACFDEFNRIDIEVLSVIAQQVMVIQRGLMERAPTILFEGREIPLKQSFGVFITMNPGYAGRSELPDNLKSLFRPVAMMVPDYRLIAEIVLFSQGFADASRLSFKMANLYSLSSEQLSKQDHYDFGMRAVKTVLVAAGNLKRKEPEVDENILLIRAMRDSNVPKFLEHDLPLFRGIIADLFPGVTVPFVDYGKLQLAIEQQLDIAGLQRVPTMITKIIQTHETQLVRHGMMIVGESGSGKTVNSDILARALAQLKRSGLIDKDGFYQLVNKWALNPKSITMGELYGEFNLATQEWRDGLVATLVRQAVADSTGDRNWIYFDGPVDAIWIENMNTVLDDNKMLCLNNGERIKLVPSMHMMFEVRDLAVASPATVSRCGMVYMEPVHVGNDALAQTWAQGEIADLLPDHAQMLLKRVLAHTKPTIKFIRSNCSEGIPSLDGNLVASFLNLLLVLLRPENGVKASGAKEPRSASEKAREKFIREHGDGPATGGSEAEREPSESKTEEGKESESKDASESKEESKEAESKEADASVPAEGEEDDEGGTPEEKAARLRDRGCMPKDKLNKVIDLAYVFAFMWSFGCNLHDNSRSKFNAFVHDLLGDLIPSEYKFAADGGPGDLYSCYLDVNTASLKNWSERKASFTYRSGMSYFSILVPSIDTTRFAYLFETLMNSGRNVLFSGETGVGKSVIVADALFRMCNGDDPKFVSSVVNFSAQTTSGNVQEALEGNLDKKRKNLLGPPSGKRMCIFIDDINMPTKEKYGAQPPIELLRQVIDSGGFYDRAKLFFKAVDKTIFAGACAPPGGGRSEITTRLTRVFHMVWLPTLTNESMQTIFSAILGGFLVLESPTVASISSEIVKASVDIYKRVQVELLPTPSKSHYTFNLRDLSKVFQGVLMVKSGQLQDRDSLLRLWVHEMQRVFRDRLISQEDRDWFNTATAEMLKSRLDADWSVSSFENVLYGDYTVRGDLEKKYIQIADQQKLPSLFAEYQEEFNMEGKAMALVFFRDAIAHVSRIARILRQPRGNALLVGVGGSGRQSLTRLAAFMSDMKCFSIEITRGYGVKEFHEDLVKIMMMAGTKQKDVVFLFSDTQIVKESFLEDVNNLLNSGTVPNIYAPDEIEACINGSRAAAKAAGKLETRGAIWDYYVSQVRDHLHIVLAMSPIGAGFRNRCRMFPALVNCCTIDWFSAWPEDALNSVARSFLGGDSKLSLGPLVEPLCKMCVRIHQSVEKASARFLAEQRRYNYTTPTSYLELLRLYTGMLNAQRDMVNGKISRYRGGLTKIAEANAMVVGLQAQLKDLQPVLEKAQADTAAFIVQLEIDQKEADIQSAIAAKDEAECAEVAKNVAIIKDDCQKDLDEALPAYYNAVKALKSLDKKQIQEVKSFANPPRLVGYVLEGVCILLGVKENWDEAKKLMNQSNFLEQLQQYDKDNIDPKVIKKVTKYIKDPEFHPDVISKVSSAATSLCLWVRAIFKYNEVALTIAPKKAKLAEAEGQLEAAQTLLNAKRESLAKVLARLAKLKAQFQESLAKRDELDRQAQMTVLRLERANKLTGGLGEEAGRWMAAADQLETDLKNLVGNMILASGCIAYIGAFTSQFRQQLISNWVDTCTEFDIPVDGGFSLVRLLSDPVQVRHWNLMGLPADEFSTENGMFTTMGRRWPLMIDPQGQANRWIKNLNKDNKLQIIKLSQPDFLRTLENAIRYGQPVLCENVEEELDPALEPVLLKQTFKKGGQVLLRLGDTDVPFSDEFKFYITTKLANPHYMPEVCIKVTVINFTVTLRGLEDQLLVDVVRFERPDLEQKKDALIVSISADKKALKDIEDRILQMLADSKGDILDDEALINSLGQSKITSNAIGVRMKDAEITTKEISTAREFYRPVATRGSILYFVIAGLTAVDSMYQFSLPAFSRVYNMRIERSTKSDVLDERIALLISDITRSFFANVCRGLFEKHKLLYSFAIAADVCKNALGISPAEWNFFLVGGNLKDAGGRNLPPSCHDWITHKQWLQLLALEALPAFAGITEAITTNERGVWKSWMLSKTPSTDPLPGHWGRIVGGDGTDAPTEVPTPGVSLSPFQRLLLTRAAREEKSVIAVREFVKHYLGTFFTEPPPFDLEGSYEDSSAQTPIIFITSPGADPIDYLLKHAGEKGKSGPTFKIISLGQGQGPIAEAAMDGARKSGDWVCLQNCHLSVSWLPKLEVILEQTTGQGEHPDYRLWLTTMASPAFPVAILQNGVKITQEPPKGIKANLMRTFLDLSDKDYLECGKPFEFKKFVFAVAFYHALCLERRKFGAIGWNVPYDWMTSDLKTGIMQIRMYLDETPVGIVPYETLNNVVGDISYGGRVTDKWDKRTNLSILRKYFQPSLVQPGEPYKFSDSGVYYAPNEAPTTADVRKYIEGLPLDETPDTFGLHENAAITLQMKETNELMSTLILMQPRSGGGGGAAGGKSNDEIVLDMVDDIQKRLPKPFDRDMAHPDTFAKEGEGINSLGVFLDQEMVRFNVLNKRVKGTLEQLKKAVKGLVVMSAQLENMFNCFLFQKVPPEWESAAYPSLKPLGYWVENFFQRLQTTHEWLTKGPPASFWVSGFFFPQGFMTGALQMYARKTRLAIDTLAFRSHVMTFSEDAVPAPPKDGVYIHGLFVVGARWNPNKMILDEMNPLQLISRVPCVWLDPALSKDINFGTAYPSPVYKTSLRAGTLSTTGHSTNFITTLYVPSEQETDHWVRRGTALLSEDESSA